MPDPVRLAPRLAELVPCSPREAELYIASGWVKVDGQVVEDPLFIVGEQKVELDPDAMPAPVEPVTILFHRPAHADLNADSVPQLIRTETQAPDNHSGIHLLGQHLVQLMQCLPLEEDASGMSVLTQDWRLARKLSDDAAILEQEYVVEVAGELSAEGLKLLNYGLSFKGRSLFPVQVSRQNETCLCFVLKEILPGQIAYMCDCVGLQMRSMKRIRIGRVSMAGLQPGFWRYLMPQERF